MNAISLDHLDIKILREMQRDASQSQRELADRVGLSQNACWRRLKSLTESGLILGQTVRLDTKALGLDVTVFVLVRTRSHSRKWLEDFRTLISAIPEVIDFHRLAGDYDYMLKIIARDIAAFDRVYRRIIDKVELDTVTSYFSMEVIENQRALPLE